MIRRLGIIGLCFMILATGLASLPGPTLAQDSTPVPPPVPTGDQLFVAEGVSSPILATAPLTDPALSGGTVDLTRIELAPGAELPGQIASGPEILYVESGDLTIEDDFGFGTTIPAGTELVLNAGIGYTAVNNGTPPVHALRLSVFRSSPDGTPAAAPLDLTGASNLLSIPIESVPVTGGTIFLAQATFQPGATIGEQTHAGPIGVYIVDGVLKMTSPSGLEGDLETGRNVVLPPTAPLQARSEIGATAIIVGVGNSSGGLMAQVTPEPTVEPTPEPTAVPTTPPEPTATPEPTPDPEIASLQSTLEGYKSAWEACNGEARLLYVTDFVLWQLDTDTSENVTEWEVLEGYDEVAEDFREDIPCRPGVDRYVEIIDPDITYSGSIGAISFKWNTESAWTDDTGRYRCEVGEGSTIWRLERQIDGRWLITDRTHNQQSVRRSCQHLAPTGSTTGDELASAGNPHT